MIGRSNNSHEMLAAASVLPARAAEATIFVGFTRPQQDFWVGDVISYVCEDKLTGRRYRVPMRVSMCRLAKWGWRFSLENTAPVLAQ